MKSYAKEYVIEIIKNCIEEVITGKNISVNESLKKDNDNKNI